MGSETDNNGGIKLPAKVAFQIGITLALSVGGFILNQYNQRLQEITEKSAKSHEKQEQYIKTVDTKIHLLEVDIASIKSSRFTSADGKKLTDELSLIWQELAKIPKENPPKWFLEKVDKMESNFIKKVDKLEESLEKRLSTIEKKLGNN